MSKAVNHMSKYTATDCGGIQKEDFSRDKNNPNLNPDKTKDNYVIQIKENENEKGKFTYTNTHEKLSLQKLARERIEKLNLPKAVRKDAVVCVSFLVSADKDFFENLSPKDQRLFFNRAVKFYSNRFGQDNILYGSVHLDEHTPHMHLRICPVTPDGRLCAKEVVNRNALQMVQREFTEYMQSKGYKLEDVEHGNKRKHRTEVEERLYHVENREIQAYLKEKVLDSSIEKFEELNGKLQNELNHVQNMHNTLQGLIIKAEGERNRKLDKYIGGEISERRENLDNLISEAHEVKQNKQMIKTDFFAKPKDKESR